VNLLANKCIILGITGGIAAYKSADLVRRLREQGAQVKVVMTPAAMQFITPLTMQALSGERVHSALLDAEAEAGMGHIELARWADVVLIAPASADCLAKLSYGHADDLLTTLCLATAAPLAVAPAMNQQMWQAAAVQENCERLRNRGVWVLGPGVGSQACGDNGAGRMLEPLELIASLMQIFTPQHLAGKKVLVTAGPTREDIDPVRFISNRSSGKMGYAVAAAAQQAGAEVILVAGPVAINPPFNVTTLAAYTAQAMLETVLAHVANVDIFIAAAAVADYAPSEKAGQKIKKTTDEMHLALQKTPDIVATVADLSQRPFIVGFAAETQKVQAYAQEKRQRKKLDMIAANLVGEGLGFESDDNALTIFWTNGQRELARCSKTQLAQQLIEVIAEQYPAQH